MFQCSTAAAARVRSESDLHRCQLCYDDSVVPVEAEPLALGRWEMRLRCGRCGTYRDVIVSDGVAERYGEALNRGMAEIAVRAEARGPRADEPPR